MEIIIPTKGLLKESARISYEKDTTIYDAIYIALAKETDYNFITSDKRLYEKVKEFQFVELL